MNVVKNPRLLLEQNTVGKAKGENTDILTRHSIPVVITKINTDRLTKNNVYRDVCGRNSRSSGRDERITVDN